MSFTKTELRRDALARRAAMGAAARAAAASRAAENLLRALPPDPGIVAVFLPIRDEIDTAPLITRLAARGTPLALPAMVAPGRPLLFRRWAPIEPTEARAFGIREPLSDAPTILPDTIISPLAAFDRALGRIGMGAGFYDATLSDLRARKSVRAIGLAFACQEVARVPIEAHDERLDLIVTEEDTIGSMR